MNTATEELFPGLDDRIRGRNALLAARRNSHAIKVPPKECDMFKRGFLSMAALYGSLDRIKET